MSQTSFYNTEGCFFYLKIRGKKGTSKFHPYFWVVENTKMVTYHQLMFLLKKCKSQSSKP